MMTQPLLHRQTMVVPSKVFAAADIFDNKDYIWFATSQIPTDLSVQVQETTFDVHKYPLLSKCGYFRLAELQPSNSRLCHDYFELENFPGGSETFVTVLRFCYSHAVSMDPQNVAALRCAAEYLLMTEEMEEGNLIHKTEEFLMFIVFSSWKDSITILKSCETLSPFAEDLQIVQRCSEAIAWKASYGNTTLREIINVESWWFDDVSALRVDHFTRIIEAVRAKGMEQELINSCILKYADKWLQNMDIDDYLAEIARDPRLSVATFDVIANFLPDDARACHDRLYKAIDIYLKSHHSLSELERIRLCEVMNCEKLSLSACVHAARNERLPIKTVIQALFSEQRKRRKAMKGGEVDCGENLNRETSLSSAEKDIEDIKAQLQQEKMNVAELQSIYAELQQLYKKLTNKQSGSSVWTIWWQKMRRSSAIFNVKTSINEYGETVSM